MWPHAHYNLVCEILRKLVEYALGARGKTGKWWEIEAHQEAA
jgi:uncharacterized membrane protein